MKFTKSINYFFTGAFLLAMFFFGACGPEEETKNPLTANAGQDAALSLGETLVLNGQQSIDRENKNFAYGWALSGRPTGSTAILINGNTATPTFRADVVGTYVIQLTISRDGFSSTDDMVLSVAPPSTIYLRENIVADKVLANLPLESGVPDYIIDADILVSAQLVIEPGTLIMVKSARSLIINSTGKLIANGTAAARIVFRGETDRVGIWKGIAIQSGSSDNSLNYVDINNAGSSLLTNAAPKKAGLFLDQASRMSITNSIINKSGGIGLYIDQSAALNLFKNNVFSSNELNPVDLHITRIPSLDEASVYGLQNGLNYIHVRGSEIVQNATWPGLDIPYALLEDVKVASSWILNSGTKIMMGSDKKIVVDVNGSMKAEGTVARRISISGMDHSRGYWKGIYIKSNSGNNSFSNVDVLHAGSSTLNDIGSGQAPWAILIEAGAQFKMNNSLIRLSGGHGIEIPFNAILTGFNNNTFIDNLMAPVVTDTKHLNQFSSESIFTNNGINAVLLLTSYIEEPFELVVKAFNDKTPYRFTGSLDLRSGMKLQPGVIFEFYAGHGLKVNHNNGYLIAEGTITNKIIFTAANGESGGWGGIEYKTQNQKNVLSFTEVLNGGQNIFFEGTPITHLGNVLAHQGYVRINNTRIAGSSSYGISVAEGGIIDIDASTVTFFGNNAGLIYRE